MVLNILHSEGADSVVIVDAVTHDDIAEIFHSDRHTVSQTIEQALAKAQLFAAAEDMADALREILAMSPAYDSHRIEEMKLVARRALAKVKAQ